MNERTLSGRCFCGNVSFEVSGPIKFACFCHCESCRRAAGGAYVPWGTFARDEFTLTSGTFTKHHSSPKVTRGHCSICGTSLTYEHEARAGQIDITLTSFDDPSQFAPEAHIWVEDRLPWVCIDDGLPQFEKTVSTN
jgi:hypothetical protein